MGSLDNAATYPRPTDGYGPPWVSEEEYLCSVREVPEEVLDAAPQGMPEELWLAAVTAEAELLPDPLSDVPGVLLAGSLADGVDSECRDGALLDRITGYERQASWAAAGQVRVIGELAKRRVAAGGVAELGCVVDEVALALTCTRQAAWARVHTAMELVDRLPDTLGSLAEGRICVARARIIAEGTRPLSDADA
ncbi:MAG: 13E12 repeat family protein, partial [Actinomycetota bacterium]|nr:13E12 repeat family protein [Actinomycetota bacterium]